MCSVGVFIGDTSSWYSFPSGHPMSGIRAKAFLGRMKKEGLTNTRGLTIFEPVKSSLEDLSLFHTEKYIEFVKKSSEIGSGFLDSGDTPVFKGIFEASTHVVGSTLKGLEMIMGKQVTHVFNPIGGLHHARKNSAAGFCVFNDVAIAIIKAKKHYNLKRILYVDIDAHHGDGVFYAFYDDPHVFIADIHEDGQYLYPGTGSKDEVGQGSAIGTKLSIPLAPHSGDQQFKEAFNQVALFAASIAPELILFQCGADGLIEDPLAHLKYSPDAHRHAADILHELAHNYAEGRILAMGGGGYNSYNTAMAWVEVIKEFLSSP